MIIFQIPLSIYIILIPVIILIFFFMSLGISLALAALHMYYRDLRYIWTCLQVGFFATPIVYPIYALPPALWILTYNPIAQIIYLTRDVMIYSKAPNLASLSYVIMVALFAICIGYWILCGVSQNLRRIKMAEAIEVGISTRSFESLMRSGTRFFRLSVVL